jgi:hypothetical protein
MDTDGGDLSKATGDILIYGNWGLGQDQFEIYLQLQRFPIGNSPYEYFWGISTGTPTYLIKAPTSH